MSSEPKSVALCVSTFDRVYLSCAAQTLYLSTTVVVNTTFGVASHNLEVAVNKSLSQGKPLRSPFIQKSCTKQVEVSLLTRLKRQVVIERCTYCK